MHKLLSAGKTCLFFTNGGYCTVEYNFNQLIKWLEHELTPEQAQFCKSKLSIELVYNTAMLAGRFLRKKISADSKVMCIGNDGLVQEI